MTSRRAQIATALGLVLVLVSTGCAWLQSQQPKLDQATEKVTTVVDHSLAVLTCASYVQRLAFDSGKRLSKEAALAFCVALEGSPDVSPAPSPVSRATTPEVI
jgi:hypothetical protein